MRILTVCIGNVCRSPMMERLLRDRLPDGTPVHSAGVMAIDGRPMEPNALAELRRLGGEAADFVARQLDGRIAGDADLILTATAAVRSRVLQDAPGALKRTFTVREFAYLAEQAPAGLADPHELVAWAAAHRSLAAGEDVDIVDPMGQTAEIHGRAADLIDEATARIAKAWPPERPSA